MSLTRIIRLRRPSPSRGDVVVGLAVAIPVLGSLISHAVHYDQPLIVLLAVGALFAIAVRERQPHVALLVAVGVRGAMPGNQALLIPALVVLYTLASRRPWPVPAAAAVVVTLASLVAGLGWGDITGHGARLAYVIGTTASCAAAVALGLYVGARRRLIAGLRERAERLDRERELLADRAVAQERVRIAQELHDVIAHTISLIVVTAQGLGVTTDDQRVVASSESIADLGRQAMAEMDRTLRLLRTGARESSGVDPQPGLANLDRLLEQARAAGLTIELTVEGQPRALPQSEDLSAFRIVQEALTNVIKHAAGARTNVTLTYQAAALRLTIADSGDGEGTGARHNAPTEGHGLVGMRERAALFGGTLTAQPRPEHGFEVTAVLPYAAADS
jgi:signal transduction histidine kinase